MLGATLACGLTLSANAQGTWTKLTNPAPENIGLALQLMDGRVMAAGANDNTWYALTPDAHGSYANGTWSTLASMSLQRLYYASKVLPNGDILVAGGEYSGPNTDDNNTNLCERYYTQTNTWGLVPTPTYGIEIVDTQGNLKEPGDTWDNIGAATSSMLPNEHVLLADLGTPTSALYDYTTNTWSPVNNLKANGAPDADEENYSLLPDGSVFTVNCQAQDPATGNLPVGFEYSERFYPGNDMWASAAKSPQSLVDHVSVELGPGMLLYNGLTMSIGGVGNTALYNYVTNKWVTGPHMTAHDGTVLSSEDGPGDVEINGKVLICVGPIGTGGANNYPAGEHFLEYTYSATANPDGSHGSFVEIPPPAGYDAIDNASYPSHFLQLPNGQILFANQYDFSPNLYVYTPQGAPNAAWLPKITSIKNNGNGSYLLTGTQFNGLTEGAYYGDDAQMSTNYPLVRFTDSAKPAAHVYYGRTYSPSTMGVATGSKTVSVSFVPPTTLPSGTYSLQVVANGTASAAIKFSKP